MIRKSLYGRIIISAILLFIAGAFYGQEIKFTDSISVNNNIRFDFLSPSPSSPLPDVDKYLTLPVQPARKFNIPESRYQFKPEFYPDFYVDKSPLTRGEYNVSGAIKRFNNGVIYGTGRQDNLIGIGTMNHAAIGYNHIFNDNLSMDVRVDAMKSNFPHYRGQSFGTSGRFSYRLNDNVRLNAFGSYFITPGMPFKSYDYGASMTLEVSEKFGVETGVRRYYNTLYGKWETVPIVMPYYKWGKVEIGMDVGEILLDLVRGWVK